ncbi:reverse transcriptase domain, Reverse transcriptase zinc-binding domain protein [Artemisia annua]|uniref:Reverse transcriptase domain, Reverse transcriptase zinc-binding domain protein n=1 Tax=Artemisia annua TaxID=35608 RepID=A0A2U1LTS6_ARTAN|nr:reverse transcriptase domain, Reverse transcriptase zinc-binding domain protein [Artemisia annua]
MRCSLCNSCLDSHTHLFFNCNYAERIWSALKRKIFATDLPLNWEDLVNAMATRFKNRNIRSVVSKIVFGAGVYYIWQERKKRHFTSEKRPAEDLLETILESVKTRLMSIRVINSPHVNNVAKEWDIKFHNVHSSKTMLNTVQ